jgi:16S rRNA (guanine527-N7)-methyltransferase
MGAKGPESPDQAAIFQAVQAGVLALNREFSPEQIQKFSSYLFLLNRWNRVHSLTAIEGLDEQVRRHLLDALAALPEVERELLAQSRGMDRRLRIADIGSGMGVPGVVWAIAMPQFDFDLVERQGKKAAFLRQTAASMGISGYVRVIEQDVTAIRGESGYDLITSRAFAALPDFVQMTYGISGPDTLWAALVGQFNEDDSECALNTMNNKNKKIEITGYFETKVPGLHESRHLVWLRRLC